MPVSNAGLILLDLLTATFYVIYSEIVVTYVLYDDETDPEVRKYLIALLFVLHSIHFLLQQRASPASP